MMWLSMKSAQLLRRIVADLGGLDWSSLLPV
jgi:hypothetical protein